MNPILKSFNIDFQWPTFGSFLFCVHHFDRYPKGNGQFAPDSHHLVGRDIGQDFQEKDGFRMYHGDSVPGFPVHPHRGFETVTIVRKGYVDHADSMGAAGRYGQGDVQWMTAGGGVQHSEMFPLLRQDSGNTVELFQIWLNLPKKSKMVSPHFTMFWSEKIPKVDLPKGGSVSVIAGHYSGIKALNPPPDSWASDPNHHVSILLVEVESGSEWSYPSVEGSEIIDRVLYFFDGENIQVADQKIQVRTGLQLDASVDLEVHNTGSKKAQFLILQSMRIPEPVFQHGPFVMNSKSDIIQTIEEYQKTRFGGWPWPRYDMVHGHEIKRFAKFPDGRIEEPQS